MKQPVFLTAAAGLLVLASGLRAQGPGNMTPGGSPPAVSPGPAATNFPSASPDPGNERAGGSPGGAGVGIPADTPGNWGCVREMKPTTRTVYSSICRKYCAPGCCSLKDLICGVFSHGDGRGGPCNLHTRNVLVKKSAPGCDVPTCTLKEGACDVCSPGPAALPPTRPFPFPTFQGGAVPLTPPAGTVLPTTVLPSPSPAAPRR